LRSILREFPWFLFAELGLLWFLVFLIETLIWPPWVAAGPQGVRIRELFSRRFYPWSRIERFEVGNPTFPNRAYLLLKSRSDGAARQESELIELPQLYDPKPKDLVACLAEAQDRFQPRISSLSPEPSSRTRG
jgi:hypothetical protein